MRESAIGVALAVVLAWAPARAEESLEDVVPRAGVRGGLIVHVGCGDGRQTATLAQGEAWLVQGLDTDPVAVHVARQRFRALGVAGRVSAELFDGRRLPYVDNLVNLIVTEARSPVPPTELQRVLCPGGVLCVKEEGTWTTTVKPRPAEMDEWTHYLHGPDNNAVADDTVVGPPRHFQWIGRPRFSRSHDHLASISVVVSAGGRIFYIVDQGSIAFAGASPRWRLVARDAFNGVVLWERAISEWEYHLRDFRSGPADLARKLVAVDDRVYVTLGYDQPVTALDAATGETLRTYSGTEETQEILYSEGTLLLVQGARQTDWQARRARQIVSERDYSPPFDRYSPPARARCVLAIDADTGALRWKNAQATAGEIMPSTLAAADGHVYFQNTEAVVCLDADTGKVRWQTPRPVHRQRLGWSTPTLVVGDGVVYSADRQATATEGDVLWIPSGGYHQYIRGPETEGELIALDANTGQRLWSCPAYEGFNAPVDVMIADELLWTGRYAWGNDPGFTVARDPRTGEVRRRRPADQEFLPRMGHARCHRAKATQDYLILGRRGVEFVDLQTGEMVANFWVRGICQYGVMPANGLLYVPPHSCACSVDDMLKCGLTALASARPQAGPSPDGHAPRLERGPAFDAAAQPQAAADGEAWPTYRHDPARSGVTPAVVSHDLRVGWQTQLGGSLTSPVVAGDLVLVAESEAHTVHALDAQTGKPVWNYVAGGRIDSPPTIHGSRVLFGSADGYVYCVRHRDGALAWRFRAAPADRRIVVDGQLESPWPVSGAVLVLDAAAYFAAGRTSYLDGGVYLCKLDVATGRALEVRQLEVPQEKRDAGIASGGYLPDVLASDDESIFMRSARFDRDLVRQKDNVPHLWSSVGFLDSSWWHRTYWQIGTAMRSGWGGWPRAGQRNPAGRILVTDGQRVFGYGRNQYDIPGAHVGVDAGGVWGPIGKQQGRWTYYRLFGHRLGAPASKSTPPNKKDAPEPLTAWQCRIPLLAQAMVLADTTLFVAGPAVDVQTIPRRPASADPLAQALESDHGGRLLAVSAADGSLLADYELDSVPGFDGMAAIPGHLYLTTKTGEVLCMQNAAK